MKKSLTSTKTVPSCEMIKVRSANVLGADADLTEFATNRKDRRRQI